MPRRGLSLRSDGAAGGGEDAGTSSHAAGGGEGAGTSPHGAGGGDGAGLNFTPV